MTKNDLFSELQERNLIAQTTNIEQVKNLINNGKAIFYVGIDPTANSLHVGHLLILTFVKRLIDHGNHAIIVIGGGTGYIGDPTNKENMRPMLAKKDIKNNCKSIKKQIKKYLKKNVTILNNSKWLTKLNYIDFLRKIGVHFNVNEMLKAECYQQRMKKGLTFLEFNYMLMQAYDFYYLVNKYHCNLQIGGNDQWSNMLAGIDIIKKISNQSVNILTTNLLLTSNNTKMGKTSEGTIWLDKNKTNEITFQQYWRNIKDDDLPNCLNWLSLQPIDEIKNDLKKISKKSFKNKEIRETTILEINNLKEKFSYEMANLFEKINQTIFEQILSFFKKKTIIYFCKKDKSITLIELLTQLFIHNNTKDSICKNIKSAKFFINNKRIKINDEIKTSDFTLDKLIKKHNCVKIDNSFSKFNIKIKKVEFNKLEKENKRRFYEKLKNQIIKNDFTLEYIFDSLPTFFLKNENEKIINNMIDNIANKIVEETYNFYLLNSPQNIIRLVMLNHKYKQKYLMPRALYDDKIKFFELHDKFKLNIKKDISVLEKEVESNNQQNFNLINLFCNKNKQNNQINYVDTYMNNLIHKKLNEMIVNFYDVCLKNDLNSFISKNIKNTDFIGTFLFVLSFYNFRCEPFLFILFIRNIQEQDYFFQKFKKNNGFNKFNLEIFKYLNKNCDMFFTAFFKIKSFANNKNNFLLFYALLMDFVEEEIKFLNFNNQYEKEKNEEIKKMYMNECQKQKKYIELQSYEEEINQFKENFLIFLKKQNIEKKIIELQKIIRSKYSIVGYYQSSFKPTEENNINKIINENNQNN